MPELYLLLGVEVTPNPLNKGPTKIGPSLDLRVAVAPWSAASLHKRQAGEGLRV